MATIKKLSNSAVSLNDPNGFAQGYQNRAGNSGVKLDDTCYSSGLCPVGPSGEVYDKTGAVQDWPYGPNSVHGVTPPFNKLRDKEPPLND